MYKVVESPVIKLVGEKVRQKRLEKGYSQDQLAIEADIPKSQVGRIERGEINTTIATLDKISQALGVTIKDLVDIY